MNLYLVEIEGVGLYSVIASDKAQCKRLILREPRGAGVTCIDNAAEKAQWFSLNTAVNWEAGITNFY